ncbi:PREDICTED: uncharacterized protein LOC106784714 isoform X1 [Polistes canadensis]|uniref:uncharacterized protein LOC106784714 isoform X1 n=1 Tax=Polistes canadensis TaxID=91411 RepID=UPI000718B72A|nr:PREDICTED: uncharacterized protein LOC106784714 isoform X1 [Polistes canadensis]
MHIRRSIMLGNVIWFVAILMLIDSTRSELLNYDKLYSFAKTFHLDQLISTTNTTDNELWHGLLKDCKKKVTFSCIQKNAYSYLDGTFSDQNNITIFDGLTLTKNNLNYGTCGIGNNDRRSIDENLIDDDRSMNKNCELEDDENDDKENDANGTRRRGRMMDERPKSPLEEITDALRQKAMKFLVTRNYEIELPKILFEGTTMKISPRQIDDTGALIRLDFNQGSGVSNEGRIFKKIKKFIQNKLIFSFIALILIIKLIKVKFLFVIPFLFGVGAAKKLFLKLLLFLIPPFAHIFKLCSSFYTSHGPKYHHHHHQIAHHHHHVPVPVPVPAYYDHHHHHEDDFNGYDYAHPHIQYRKDVEELKEWGIEPYDDLYEDTTNKHVPGVLPAPMNNPISEYPTGTNYNNQYGIPQYAANVRPVVVSPSYKDKYPLSISAHAHNLAYSGYLDDKYNRRVVEPNGISTSVKSVNVLPGVPVKQPITNVKKNTYGILSQANVRQAATVPRINKVVATSKNSIVSSSSVTQTYDDDYYGPIINRLEDIFAQLRFFDESCRERLICSMYKNPTVYSPHSNLVSNELSRDPQELKRGTLESASSQKFHKYLNAARIGQDRGDCVRTYPCHINTE